MKFYQEIVQCLDESGRLGGEALKVVLVNNSCLI